MDALEWGRGVVIPTALGKNWKKTPKLTAKQTIQIRVYIDKEIRQAPLYGFLTISNNNPD